MCGIKNFKGLQYPESVLVSAVGVGTGKRVEGSDQVPKTPKNPKKPRKIRIWTKLCVKFGLPYPETEDAGRGTPWTGHHVG
jgi:hypothetical protein